MIRNYLKTAFRNVWVNKGNSFINIFGLAAGIASSLLIFLFVKDELSYDQFHKDTSHIYRIVKDFMNDDGTTIPDATTPGALAPAMEREMPEVAAITRIRPNWGRSYLIKYGNKKITEEKLFGVDSSFFDVFTFPFTKGNARSALKNANSIIVTESAAKKIFGNEDPMGKTVDVDAFGPMMVSGVIKDVPPAAHFHFQFLVPFQRQPGNAAIDNNWIGYNDYTYVKTKPGTNIPMFVKKIQSLNDRNVEKSFSNFYVQPLKDIHLTSNLKWELEPNGDRQYVSHICPDWIFYYRNSSHQLHEPCYCESNSQGKGNWHKKSSRSFKAIPHKAIPDGIGDYLSFRVYTRIVIGSNIITICKQPCWKATAIIRRSNVASLSVNGSDSIGTCGGVFPCLISLIFQTNYSFKRLQVERERSTEFKKGIGYCTIHYFYCAHHWCRRYLSANELSDVGQARIKYHPGGST
jgi:hypothetical protein